MKKLILLALALMLCASALAEVDVKDLTDTELKLLYKDVMAELMERKIWQESILPAGIYSVGKPLPEGNYFCEMRSRCGIKTYRNQQAFERNEYSYTILSEGETYNLALYGDIVIELDSDAIVHPFVGLDW